MTSSCSLISQLCDEQKEVIVCELLNDNTLLDVISDTLNTKKAKFNDEEQQEDKVSELLNDNTLLDVISDTLILCV